MFPRFPDQVVSCIKYTLLFAWSKLKSGSVWLVDRMLRHLRIKILELWGEMLGSVFWGDVGRLRSGGNVQGLFKEIVKHLTCWNNWGKFGIFEKLELFRWIWEFGTFETILSCFKKFWTARVMFGSTKRKFWDLGTFEGMFGRWAVAVYKWTFEELLDCSTKCLDVSGTLVQK